MEQKNSKIFSKETIQSVTAFCESQEIKDVNNFMYLCFKQGFDIKKYGFLGGEVSGEVTVEVIKEVEKIVYKTDDSQINELLLKIQQLETEMSKSSLELDELRQKFSTKEDEITTKEREFSTITTENENIFQYKISKKDEELDELRHSLDKLSVVVKNETTESLLKPKIEALQKTLQELRKQIREKDKFILQLRKDVLLLQEQPNKRAIFLASTNLNNEIK
jgi:chromosome segregation ATPase